MLCAFEQVHAVAVNPKLSTHELARGPTAEGVAHEGPRSRSGLGKGRLTRSGLSERRREAIAAYVFLAPWLLGLVGLTLGPVLASFWISFTRYDLISAPQWIGLQNYASLPADERYLQSARVTLAYVLTEVPLRLAFALLLALVLNRGRRGLDAYRAVYYLPSLLGGSVAIAVLWRYLFGVDSLVNVLLRTLGWPDPPIWLANPRYALSTLILLGIWQFGSPMIIFLAGLRQIPRELYEAAEVDGAGAATRLARITLPLLTPLILFNLVLQIIGAFQAFTPAFIVSGGSGGPVDSTLLYTLYLYEQAFGFLHMGYAAAMAWILLVTIAAITAVIFSSSRYWVFYMEEAG
jgi:multiple sugar transport system permease protein